VIEVRKLPDGRVQARRLDGKPMMDADFVEARRIASAPSFTPLTPEQIADINSGNVIAVLIDSSIVGAPLWFSFSPDFDPCDDIPVFYSAELPFLKDKPAATLRKIYETKKAFPGTRVRQ
jgi:hypothetical protein